MRALVTGAAGQLGRDLVTALGADLAWAGGRAELDITDAGAVDALFKQRAARRRVQRDGLQQGRRRRDRSARALEVNALGPSCLARAARDAGALFVHFSTDYVFDGSATRPYREDDCPRPLGAYGASKLAGENLVASARGESLVIRTSAVFGRGGNRQRAARSSSASSTGARRPAPARRLRPAFSPTYSPDLAAAALALVKAGARGLVHVSGAGACSWHELAVAALRLAGVEAPVEAIRAADLNLAAARPRYSVLDNGRYQGFGLPALRRLARSASRFAGQSLTPPRRSHRLSVCPVGRLAQR